MQIQPTPAPLAYSGPDAAGRVRYLTSGDPLAFRSAVLRLIGEEATVAPAMKFGDMDRGTYSPRDFIYHDKRRR